MSADGMPPWRRALSARRTAAPVDAGAVAVGLCPGLLAVAIVLVGPSPPTVTIPAVGVALVLGGWLAARMTREHPVVHGALVGIGLLALGTLIAIADALARGGSPVLVAGWSSRSVVAGAMPTVPLLAMFGAILGRNQ